MSKHDILLYLSSTAPRISISNKNGFPYGKRSPRSPDSNVSTTASESHSSSSIVLESISEWIFDDLIDTVKDTVDFPGEFQYYTI